MAFHIKRIGPGDLALAKGLFLFFQIDDGEEEPTFASDDYLRNLLAKDDFHVVAALEGEKVLGGLTAYELPNYKEEYTEMFLYEIGVSPDYRRRGVARALIEYLKGVCREKGIEDIFVGASAGNQAARRLYESTGGTGEEVVEFYYEID